MKIASMKTEKTLFYISLVFPLKKEEKKKTNYQSFSSVFGESFIR